MKTKKQTEKQELKYAPGDKVVYHCAGVDREGLIAYVDDTDNVAPYRINGMNIRESDIVEKIAKRRGRPAAKKQVEEKMEVVVNAEPKQKKLRRLNPSRKKSQMSNRHLLRSIKLSRARSTWRNSTTWSTWLLQTRKRCVS